MLWEEKLLERHALDKIGAADCAEIVRNPSFERFFEYAMDGSLTGCRRGVLTRFRPMAVDTSRFTGRSPKDTVRASGFTARAFVTL